MSIEKLTVPEKLLLAALEVRKRSATFTAEDLVVEAWKQYPDTFGLSGYADQFPDSNRVLTNIMGTKGMRGKKGWLRKVGEKQYRLTSTGLSDGEQMIRALAAGGSRQEASALRAELDRHASVALARIIGTSAVRKVFAQELDALTFNDACGFWDITVRSNANTLNAKLAETTVLLDRALAAISSHGAADALKINNVAISKHQIESLIALHRDMQINFKSELDIIRKRTDERLERKTRPF